MEESNLKPMLNPTIIGQYFYEKDEKLTDIQIQKLVYYAYSWYMVKNKDKKIFDENPQAWAHGPVFKSLFNSMKHHKKFSSCKDYKKIKLDQELIDFLNEIYNIYSKYSGNELEIMTHAEAPWQNAIRLNKYKPSQNEISDEDIVKYYG